jgi:hypothetical protein
MGPPGLIEKRRKARIAHGSYANYQGATQRRRLEANTLRMPHAMPNSDDRQALLEMVTRARHSLTWPITRPGRAVGDERGQPGHSEEQHGRQHQLRWYLDADDARQDFWFSNFELQPGQECRVYTSEDHPEWCGFNFRHTGSALWANGGECGHLYDPSGAEVSTYCY